MLAPPHPATLSEARRHSLQHTTCLKSFALTARRCAVSQDRQGTHMSWASKSFAGCRHTVLIDTTVSHTVRQSAAQTREQPGIAGYNSALWIQSTNKVRCLTQGTPLEGHDYFHSQTLCGLQIVSAAAAAGICSNRNGAAHSLQPLSQIVTPLRACACGLRSFLPAECCISIANAAAGRRL